MSSKKIYTKILDNSSSLCRNIFFLTKSHRNILFSINNNIKINNNSIYNFIKKNFFKKTNILNRVRNYNFYDVLGIEQDSTNDQIKQAYLKLAKQYHPDVNKDIGSDEKFKSLTIAYEALSNKRKRDLYDAYMDSDPYSDYDFWKDEENFSKQDKAKHDRQSEHSYKNTHKSNFWNEKKDDFEDKFYKDYDYIFNSGFKHSRPQKGEDILVNKL